MGVQCACSYWASFFFQFLLLLFAVETRDSGRLTAEKVLFQTSPRLWQSVARFVLVNTLKRGIFYTIFGTAVVLLLLTLCDPSPVPSQKRLRTEQAMLQYQKKKRKISRKSHLQSFFEVQLPCPPKGLLVHSSSIITIPLAIYQIQQ